MKKKILSFFMSVILLLSVLSIGAHAEGGLTLTLVPSVASDVKLSLGDTVTYTVKLTENGTGVSFGTLYFAPSHNLTYVSATVMGNDCQAIMAPTGNNTGAYGILLYGDIIEGTKDDFCTITFKVTERGNATVSFYTYELNNGSEFITPVIENGTVSHEILPPSAPIITTEALNEGMMGVEFSQRLEATYPDFTVFTLDGKLPDGLSLSDDGTISGTPTEFGEFPLTFTATLLGELVSEPKTLTLTILEKPRSLELNEGSSLSITEDGLLIGVKEKTTVSELLSNFKNSDNVKVYKGDETASDTSYVGTAFTVVLCNGEETVHSVTVVVKGDVSGNGQVDPIDYQRVRRYLAGKYSLEGAYLEAAKVSGKNNVTPIDYQRIRRHINGNYNIYE